MPKPPRVSVYQRADHAFSVRWREHGRQHEERGYATRDDAESRAEQVRQRLRRGLPGTRSTLPLVTLIEAWYEDYALEHLSQAARETYKSVQRLIVPLAQRDAHTIQPADVYAWSSQAARHASPRAVNKALTMLSSVFQRGVEWGWVEQNPIRGVRRLPEQRGVPTIPTSTDIDHLLRTAPSERDRLMLRVATLAGLRQSELFALDWQHVHATHLSIERALDRDGSFKTTKTKKPRRVPIPASLSRDLQALSPGTRKGLVFTNTTGKPMSRTNYVRRVWHPWRLHAAWQAAVVGDEWHRLLEVKWMHLRHHYASRLASVGATMLQASRWMGHGTIRTTMDRYGFLFDEDEAEVMAALGE